MKKQDSLIYDMLRTPAQVQEEELLKIRKRAQAQQAAMMARMGSDPIINALQQGFADVRGKQTEALARRNQAYTGLAGGVASALGNEELGQRLKESGLTPEARQAAQLQSQVKGMPRRSAQDLFAIADKLDSVGQAQKAEQVRDRARQLEDRQLDSAVKQSAIAKNLRVDSTGSSNSIDNTFGRRYGVDVNKFSDASYAAAVKVDQAGPNQGETAGQFRSRVINTLEAKKDKPTTSSTSFTPLNDRLGMSRTGFEDAYSSKSIVAANRVYDPKDPTSVNKAFDLLRPQMPQSVSGQYEAAYGDALTFRKGNDRDIITALNAVDKSFAGAGVDVKTGVSKVFEFMGMDIEGLTATQILDAFTKNNAFIEGLKQNGVLTKTDFDNLEKGLGTGITNSKAAIKMFLSKAYSKGIQAELYTQGMDNLKQRFEDDPTIDIRLESIKLEEEVESQSKVQAAKILGVSYGLNANEREQVQQYYSDRTLVDQAVRGLVDPRQLSPENQRRYRLIMESKNRQQQAAQRGGLQ